jgi:hypothetical protein
MPSTSVKQEKFMRAVANSPKFAKKVGVPQGVGKEFEMKDMKKMAMGGKTTYAKGGGVEHKGKTKGKMVKMAEGGGIKAVEKSDTMMDKVSRYSPMGMLGRVGSNAAKAGAKMAKEGSETSEKVSKYSPMSMVRKAFEAGAKTAKKTTENKARGGSVGKMVKMAAGGSVSKRADGIAKKGKTNCKVM